MKIASTLRKMFLASALVFVIVPSCSKKKYCWKCTEKITYTGTVRGLPPSSTATNTVCDQTEEENINYQKAATITTNSGGITYKQVVTCVKE